MKQELSTLESVEHPALVKVLDRNLDEEWFVMEFLEGGTLSNCLESYKGRVLATLVLSDLSWTRPLRSTPEGRASGHQARQHIRGVRRPSRVRGLWFGVQA